MSVSRAAHSICAANDGVQDRPSSCEDADEADGDRGALSPSADDEARAGAKSIRICCAGWRSLIEGAKPRDELESALVIQMACTHSAAMAVLSRLGGAAGGDRSVVAMASAAARLLRAYATQVEALRRLRNGGSQTVRIEHVHVNEGGQAVIGNVNSIPGSGR